MKRVGLFLDRSLSCVRDVLDGVAMFLSEQVPPERWECWYADDLERNELRPIALDGALVMISDHEALQRLRRVAPVIVDVLGSPSLGFDFPAVVCDDVQVGRVAAKELLERGHRELAFVANTDTMLYDHTRKRIEGFTEEAQLIGARVQVGPGKQTLRAFLRQLPRPCGVLAMNDVTGKFVLDACRAEQIRVPQEIAVLGVDNDPQMCELSWPPLATVQAGHFEVGYAAARRLSDLLSGAADDGPSVQTAGTPEVLVRASVDSRAIDDELVAQALQWITLHAHEPVSVSDICDQVRAGRRSLEKRFRLATGKSILETVHWTRVQIAKRLLKNRRLSIEQVSTSSGFSTQTQLGVIFRRLVGTTPTHYRRRVLSMGQSSR